MELTADPAAMRMFSANPLFRLLRACLHAVQRLAPGWAPRLAARVFCTPLPTKLGARRLDPPPGVRIESLPFERASFTLYHWPAPEGAPQLLMTHGWGGWGMQMAPLAEALSQAGWAVVVIDQPAHGRSAAWSSTLPQFVRALQYAAARLGRVEALVGHSMGGAAACIAAANGLALRKLALVSAPVSMVQATRDYAAAFGLGERLRAGMVAHLEAREGMVFERMGAAHTGPRVAAPTLVVHDHDDTTVPYAASQALMQALPAAQLYSTSGLGHRRVLKDLGVIQTVGAFIGPAAVSR